MKKTRTAELSVPLTTIGFILWLVFLILKLCNLDNPDFAWLTWFWVWFPFWFPIALDVVFGTALIVIYKVFLE